MSKQERKLKLIETVSTEYMLLRLSPLVLEVSIVALKCIWKWPITAPSKGIVIVVVYRNQPPQQFLLCFQLWWCLSGKRSSRESRFLIKSHQTRVSRCSCCVEHKCHRYWFYPWHLCCETRLLQRKRWAGNFPQCDSLLLFTEGACAQNQDRKRQRKKEREAETGGGWEDGQKVQREKPCVSKNPMIIITWKEFLKRNEEEKERSKGEEKRFEK